MMRKNVLFLCDDNAARSLMAEAYLNHAGRARFRAWSAGFTPCDTVDPAVLSLLGDAGIRTRGMHPKSWRVFAAHGAPRMDLVVTLSIEAGLDRAALPGAPGQVHWPVSDPALTPGLGGGERGALRELFAEIRQLVDGLLVCWPPYDVLFPLTTSTTGHRTAA